MAEVIPLPSGQGGSRSEPGEGDWFSEIFLMNPKPPLLPQVNQRVRRLRKEMTIPERLLWAKLRDCRLSGLKFRRQHPIDHYVVDFYCHEHHLVIELDGDSHIGTAAYDERRTLALENQQLRVIRFTNDDVIQDLDSVLEAMLLACGIGA